MPSASTTANRGTQQRRRSVSASLRHQFITEAAVGVIVADGHDAQVISLIHFRDIIQPCLDLRRIPVNTNLSVLLHKVVVQYPQASATNS